MTTESRPSVLDEAWGRFPQTQETTAGTGSFTRSRVERSISLAIGVGQLALGVQAFLGGLGVRDEMAGGELAAFIVTFTSFSLMVISCFVGRGTRITTTAFIFIYAAVLVAWPFLVSGPLPPPTSEPWIWYLVNVATVAGVLAFPLPLQIAWTILAPLLFGVARLAQGGYGPDQLWIAVGLDVSFALILGGVLTSLGWMFRGVASNVDRTRARAVESYAAAAAAEATEKERVAVAALMHDSVLAALIAAERAHTPRERMLAVAMAREALTRLANTDRDAGEGTDEPTDASAIAAAIERGAHELGVALVVERTIEPSPAAIPGRVARALVLAATQAIANAVEHAGGKGLSVGVRGVANPVRVRIDVRDTGGGFDLDGVGDDRLGIRGSIIARVAAVGGAAHIESGTVGTTVRLEWREGDE